MRKSLFNGNVGFLDFLNSMEHRERIVLTANDDAISLNKLDVIEIYRSDSDNYYNISISVYDGYNMGKPKIKKTKCLNPKYGSNDKFFLEFYNQYISVCK